MVNKKSTNNHSRKIPKSPINTPQSSRARRFKIYNKNSVKNFLSVFKASHPWIKIAPPRPKNQRNRITVRKDLHPVPELFEYVEPQQMKIETLETKPTTMSRHELAARFKMLNGSDLGSLYQGEFGKGQQGYTGEFEIYSTDSPIGQQYQGYMTNKDTGKIEECHIFILPKN